MEKKHFYLREAISQLEYAKRSYFEYQQAMLANDTYSVFYHLHHFIVHVVNVDKLFTVKPNSIRELVLKESLRLLDVDLKPLRTLRNHLEHFDERLDIWIQNHDGSAFFDNNIITGAKGFPEKAFLRALDGDVYKFYGESFSIVPILEAVNKLHGQLIKLDG